MGFSGSKMVKKSRFQINKIKIIISQFSTRKNSPSLKNDKQKFDNLEIIKELDELGKVRFLTSNKKLNNDIVFFGLGGSSLGLKTIMEVLQHNNNSKKVAHIIDNLDGETFNDLFKKISIKSTKFIFISKSGETYEIKKLLLETIKKIKEKKLKINERIIFITEDNNGYLNNFGKKNNILIHYINPKIGGRFSVLSKSTLIPCELTGIKWKKIVSGGLKTYKVLEENNFKLINSLASFHYNNLLKNKTNTGIISYKDSLNYFGEWFMQLWGESLGKVKKNGEPIGLTPSRYLGPKDQHSQMQLILDGLKDKTITFLSTEKDENGNSSLKKAVLKEKDATIKALTQKEIPHIEFQIRKLNEETLGSLFIIFQLTTIELANKMRINPFDQPAVELIKKNLKN